MNFLQQIFSEQMIYSLGWTLIHSLWQGALIGFLLAVIMIFMHRYTARLRYFIHSISLFLLAGLAIVTFIGAYTSYEAPVVNNTDESISYPTGMIIDYELLKDGTQEEAYIITLLEDIAAYCRNNMPLFVMIWLLGLLASLLRFLGGYALVRRYRSHRVRPVGGEWEQRFRTMKARIKVRKDVRLLESALIKVPMAIGYLKPVVLLPLGALNGVSAVQMEAILAHELAHIRRRDYLMNMIQSLLEVVFFYHPVVWWISGNIRSERENICDDIAITITGNTMEFAKALKNIQEINLHSPALAAGLSGKNRNQLVNRIRRLAGKPKVQSGFAEGFIAAFILVVSLIGLSAAAMITYPADKAVEPVPVYETKNTQSPDFLYFTPSAIVPDTTDKKKVSEKQEQKEQQARAIVESEDEELSEEQKEKIRQIEIQVAEEMKQVEAAMQAIEEEVKAAQKAEQYQEAMHQYQKAIQQVHAEREEYLKEIQHAMQEHQENIGDMRVYWDQNYHLYPRAARFPDSLLVIRGDSSVWHQYYKGNYQVFSDSLHDLYFDKWSEVDLEHDFDFDYDFDEKFMEQQEKLAKLEELYVAPEALNFYHDFDPPAYVPHPGFGISDRAKRIVAEELHADNLIEHGREYVVVINDKQMLINGEKQSRSVFKKYSRLVESMEEPWGFDSEDEFKIFIGH